MSNNLQALRVLKESAKKQNEELESSIKEIHEQSLKQLSEDFKSTTSKKLNSIEKSINTTMQDIREQNKWKYSLKHLLIAILATALIFLFMGMILADYTPKMSERIAWTVPKEMRYTHEDGTKYIRSSQVEHNSDKTVTYIKIGE